MRRRTLQDRRLATMRAPLADRTHRPARQGPIILPKVVLPVVVLVVAAQAAVPVAPRAGETSCLVGRMYSATRSGPRKIAGVRGCPQAVLWHVATCRRNAASLLMAGEHHEVSLRRWHITALEAFSTGQVAECGAKCASSELAIGSLIPQSSAEWRSSLGLIRFSESIAPFSMAVSCSP
jgi:hypothetical protein